MDRQHPIAGKERFTRALYEARPATTLLLGLIALLCALAYALLRGDEPLAPCVIGSAIAAWLGYAAATRRLRRQRARRAALVAVVRAQWQARNDLIGTGAERRSLEGAPRPVPVPAPPRLRLLRDARLCGALSCVAGGTAWASGAVHATLAGHGIGPAEVAALTLGGLIATYGMLLNAARRRPRRVLIVHHATAEAWWDTSGS